MVVYLSMNKLIIYIYIYICSSMIGQLLLSPSCSHVFVHGFHFFHFIFVHGLDIACLGILDTLVVHLFYLFYCMLLIHLSFIKSRWVNMWEVFVPSLIFFTLRFYSIMWCFAFPLSKGGLWWYTPASKDFTHPWVLSISYVLWFCKGLKTLKYKIQTALYIN